MFKTNRTFGILIFVFLALGMAGCGDRGSTTKSGSGATNYTKGEATLKDGITTLDSSTSSQVTASDDTSVTFTGSPSSITALKPGDIFIVNNTARKVESVTSSGSQTVVKTTSPDFSEVVKTLEIEGDVWLTEEHIAASSASSKLRFSTKRLKSKKSLSINTDTGDVEGKSFYCPIEDVVIYDSDGDEDTASDQVIANGEVVIEKPRVRFKFKYGKGNDYTSLYLYAKEDFNLSLSSEAVSFNKEVSIPLGDGFVIPIAVTGGTVYVKIPVNLVFSANGTAKIVVDVSQKLTIDTKIEAALGPVSITTTDNSDFDFDFENPQIDGEVTGSIAVNPDVDLTFLQWELAGLSNSLGIKATAKASLTSANTCYRITADADASSTAYVMVPKASLNLGFLWDDDDSSLLDFDMEEYPKELFTKTWPLYDSGEQCAVTYEAPVANAGADVISNTNATVLLDGTGSYDNDGTIASYQWTQTAGTQVVALTDADTATPSFTAPATADNLSFQLTVTDNNGSTATDSVTISVMTGDSNYRPTANAGPDQSVSGSSTVYLDGSASSDSDGSIASYSWMQTGGTNVSLTNSNTSTPSFTASSSTDTLTFKLAVADNKGATAIDYVQIFVQTSDGGGSGVPSAPSGISATAGDGQVSITWDSVSGATSYNIYWSNSSGVSKSNSTKLSNVTSPYTHTGLTNGTTYYYVVTAVNSYGESAESSEVSAMPNDTSVATGRMPDTNQTTSYTTTFGEDHDYTINPPSYTDNGDGTITDNVTGLTWQKQDDATTRTWADAGAYCDASTLGGYSDWRLPSQIELISIIDNGVYNPSINTTFFPGTSSEYWSSTTYASNTSAVWDVDFINGYSDTLGKTYSYYTRCVRGGQTTPSLTDNGNGTVTDSGTILTWQQGENSAMTWEAALSYCEGLSLAGDTDWRLPNYKELLSLVDYSRNNPAINTTLFPSAISLSFYWSSTTGVGSTSDAWVVTFYYGGSSRNGKTSSYYARCVRGGQ